MKRILKKYTTIPQHLYIERNADFQLKSIIEDMQRPGYVLVARQMGKTNLLVNAKRTMENETRLFVYVDLSNPYKDEQECFRSIINNIIEVNFDIFEQIYGKIQDIRAKNLPAHNEYLRSLVLILKHYLGDLIIILDEIDALKSAEYSDNIFAQIRSNYFSRTNFTELERLTYILSGVIEPTELIKDKNKSPFNIGDKIYLDDFTYEEHNTFIYKSKLSVSKEISEELFEWTNGNPRLTFDICSELESIILEGKEIDSEILSEVIRKKYLIAFDLAPIDHIRELVKENKFIRDAIKNIYSNKSDLLNSDIKSRLYLYGIINSKFSEKTVIKNKIIQEALNEDWIRSLDNEKTFFQALTKFSEGSYEEVVDILEHTIYKSHDDSEIEQSNYYLGLSYYNIGDFKNATKYLCFDFQKASLKSGALAYYGASLIKLEDGRGLEILEEVVLNETHDSPYHFALLNLGINTEDKEKALTLLFKLIDSTYKSNNSCDILDDLRALSYFYISNIYEFQNNIGKAIEMLDKSLEFTIIEDKPILLYYNLLLKSKEMNSTIEYKNILVNSIVDEKIRFSNKKTYPIGLDKDGFVEILNSVFDNDNTYPFLKLVNYISSELVKSNKKCIDIIISSAQVSNSNSTKILEFAKKIFFEKLDVSQSIEIERLLVNFEKDVNKYISSFNQYFDLIKKHDNYELSETDVDTLIGTIQRFFTSKMFKQCKEICEFLESRIIKSDNKEITPFLSITYFWKANLAFIAGNKFDSIKFANDTLSFIEKLENTNNNIIDPSSLTTMKQLSKDIILRVSPLVPNINNTKSIKNHIVTVRYKNGKVRNGRLKHFENDLFNGKCIIVDNN